MEGGAFEPKKQGEHFALAKEQFFGHGNHLLLKSERTSTRGAKRKSKAPPLFFSEARRSFALFFFKLRKSLFVLHL